VTRNGRLVYARGFGYADRDAREPVEPTALFRIASISKPVTAVAILQLVEQGRLGLDDQVCDVLEIQPHLEDGAAVDPRLSGVTIRHLLQHTGGWDRDASFDPMFRSPQIVRALGVEPPARPWDIIRYMAGRPLDFDPGTKYAYSNFGYCLLGRVIEKVTGRPYEQHVQEAVLAPVGVDDMRIGRTLREERAEGEVVYYDYQNRRGAAIMGPHIGRQVPWPYGTWCVESMDAHGGWIASAPDLVRFASAFDDPEHSPLLGPPSIAVMFARPDGPPGLDKEGRPSATYYGCGWQVRPIAGTGRANTWHAGSLDGTETLLVRRHDGLNWAVLFNTRNNPAGKSLVGLIDPLLHGAADAVREWPEPGS